MLGHGGPRPTRWRTIAAAGLVVAGLLPELTAWAAPDDSPPTTVVEDSSVPGTDPVVPTDPASTTVPDSTVPPTTTTLETTTTTTAPTTTTVPPTTSVPTTTEPPRTTTTTVPDAPEVVDMGQRAVRCTVTKPVRYGAESKFVRCIEERLAALGYDIRPDRYFRRGTADALRLFQHRHRVFVTGLATLRTLKELRIWSGPDFSQACTVGYPVRRSEPGPRVRCLERRLARLGFDVNFPDERFDGATVRAVERYQRIKRIRVVRNVATALTLDRLSIWSGQPLRSSCRVAVAVRWGQTSPDVTCVEQRLARMGFDIAGPNGYFDHTVATAMRTYQSEKGIPADGVGNAQTLTKMGIWNGPAWVDPWVVPANSGTGRRVVYSRARQRVWAIEADGTVVKTHLVSGRLYEPYAGTYYVYSRSLYAYSAANPAIRWMYMVRFAYGPGGGRIGLHEIPNINGVPVQSESQLGQPLSGGCVRQSTPNAIWMWNWAPLGTKVVVL